MAEESPILHPPQPEAPPEARITLAFDAAGNFKGYQMVGTPPVQQVVFALNYALFIFMQGTVAQQVQANMQKAQRGIVGVDGQPFRH